MDLERLKKLAKKLDIQIYENKEFVDLETALLEFFSKNKINVGIKLNYVSANSIDDAVEQFRQYYGIGCKSRTARDIANDFYGTAFLTKSEIEKLNPDVLRSVPEMSDKIVHNGIHLRAQYVNYRVNSIAILLRKVYRERILSYMPKRS